MRGPLEAANWNRRYRHLLLTPYRLMELMPKNNRIVLDGKLAVHGDFTEQFVSKLYLMRVPGVAEAVDLLYYDPARRGPKVGIVPKIPKRGDFRNRFPRRIEQLQLTYDINILSGKQLVGLLGDEFAQLLATTPS